MAGNGGWATDETRPKEARKPAAQHGSYRLVTERYRRVRGSLAQGGAPSRILRGRAAVHNDPLMGSAEFEGEATGMSRGRERSGRKGPAIHHHNTAAGDEPLISGMRRRAGRLRAHLVARKQMREELCITLPTAIEQCQGAVAEAKEPEHGARAFLKLLKFRRKRAPRRRQAFVEHRELAICGEQRVRRAAGVPAIGQNLSLAFLLQAGKTRGQAQGAIVEADAGECMRRRCL